MGRRNRSSPSRQRRYANHLVSRTAFVDVKKAESVNVLSQAEIYDALSRRFRRVHRTIIHNYDEAEVVSDSRGEGTLQKVESKDE